MNLNDKLNEVILEIRKGHQKIIEDWCKAYLAQLYEEGIDLKPGCFVLNEQELHERDGIFVKRYWFCQKDELYQYSSYEKKEKLINQILEAMKDRSDIEDIRIPFHRLKNLILDELYMLGNLNV